MIIYKPTGTTYIITSIADLFQLTPAQQERALLELQGWLDERSKLIEQIEFALKLLNIPEADKPTIKSLIKLPEYFEWIDDDILAVNSK